MAPEELRLDARGLELGALRWRNGERRVLALHGWLDNAESFRVLAPQLAGCDVVAIDFPGHGRSAHRGAGTLQHFVEYIADVAAAQAALGWDRSVLLGHSMGGGVAGYFAGVYPERVQQLVMIEGFGSGSREDASITDSLRRACDAALRGGGMPATYPDMAAALAARNKGFWPLPDDAAPALLARALTARDGGLRWHTDARLRQPSAARLTEAQCQALLAAIRAPALLIGGSGGLFADPAAHAARTALVPGLAVQVLPGGHHLHLQADAAPAVAAAVLAFLAG